MKKSELQKVTETNVNSCSSSETNTIQDSTITTQLSEDKVSIDSTPDDILVKQDNSSVRSAGNVESISVSSIEFVDIVSGKCN